MIKLAVPCYNMLEKHLPKGMILTLNNITLNHQSYLPQGKWKSLLMQMTRITVIYAILSAAGVALMLAFFLPFIRHILPHWWANAVCGLFTVLLISPFLRAMVMKKNHSEEFKALWNENIYNRIPLIFTIVVRLIIASAFIFYICNYLTRFTNALMISIAVVVVALMVISRGLKRRSIKMERMFLQNLHSREIKAEVLGQRKPLYEGHLLDRDVHMADFEVPEDSLWSGKTLGELQFRNHYGVHVSSILRGKLRINIPNGQTMIFPGDRIQAIGNDEQLTAFSSALDKDLQQADPEIEKREMKLRQVVIGKNSVFAGKTLYESRIREDYNCMVVGLDEGKESLTFIEPTFSFSAGDVLWIVGEQAAIDKFSSDNT